MMDDTSKSNDNEASGVQLEDIGHGHHSTAAEELISVDADGVSPTSFTFRKAMAMLVSNSNRHKFGNRAS